MRPAGIPAGLTKRGPCDIRSYIILILLAPVEQDWGRKTMIESLALSNYAHSETKSQDCISLQFGRAEEENSLQCYTLFPGINLLSLGFHMDCCPSNFYYAEKTISIDYCREGRVEWERGKDNYCYLGEKDVQFSAQSYYSGSYGFPTRHYHGFTVTIQVQEAQKGLESLRPYFVFDLEKLYDQLISRHGDLVIRASQQMEELFGSLGTFCQQGDREAMRLRILHLLLGISRYATVIEPDQDRPYFPKKVVEKVRDIKNELCGDLNCRKTVSELAEEHQISETMLKRCFHAMYGNSVYAFVKEYRLQTAARELATTDRPVMEIALEVGYENPSKFSAAFRSQYGETPTAFRAQKRREITGQP